MLPVSGQIAAAQVAVFALAVPPLIYILFKHGKQGILGWFFLTAFCILRLVGGSMILSAESKDTFSSTGALVSQIGLSPLCFAASGITHEASCTVARRAPFFLGWPMQVLIHLATSAGLALVIVGASNAGVAGQSPDEINQAIAQLRAGGALFLVVLIMITGIALLSYREPRSNAAEKRLILVVVVILPELLLRVLYLFVGAVINNTTWSVLAGAPLAAEIVLELVPEFLIIILLIYGGYNTRNLPQERGIEESPSHNMSNVA